MEEKLIQSSYGKTETLSPFVSVSGHSRVSVDLADEHSKNQLGTLNGVYVPCLLNILGAVLFLRIGFSVGELGVIGTLVIFVIAECIAVSTVLSVSAIVSNGDMKGGGCYYMISRSLGPAFGASSGLLFYVSYAVGITFYVIAFSNTVVATIHPHCSPWEKGCDLSKETAFWLDTGIASGTLFAVLAVSMGGAGMFAKVNTIIFTFLFISVVTSILSLIFKTSGGALPNGGTYIPGVNFTQLSNNLFPDMGISSMCSSKKCTVSVIFATIFPAVTGIMEGANLSGDLKDPGKSIGKGTLLAVSTSFVIYTTLIVAQGFHFTRDALKTNMYIMQESCISQYIVITGISTACISSALGSLFGGPRVLQAIARDGLLPLGWFAYGTKKGDEPLVAVLITWAISQGCIFMGSLDQVASLITNFFLTAYATTNIACFLLEVSGVPNFRPKFKYYTWYTALIGGIINIAVMFYLDAIMAGATFLIMGLIYVYVTRSAGKHTDQWGNVNQAILYFYVRKFLLRMDENKDHVKYWRSSVLLLMDDVDLPILQFCNKMKKGGLYVIGVASLISTMEEKKKEMAITESKPNRIGRYQEVRREWQEVINSLQIKAFPSVSIASSAGLAYRNLMLSSGLGCLRPELVVLPLMGTKQEVIQQEKRNRVGARRNGTEMTNLTSLPIANTTLPVKNATEYYQIIEDAMDLNKGIIILGNTHRLESQFENLLKANPKSCPSDKKLIDLWMVGELDGNNMDSSISLLIQVGHILRSNRYWDNSVTIRVLRVCTQNTGGDSEHPDIAIREDEMKYLIDRARMMDDVTEIDTVECPGALKHQNDVPGTEGFVQFCQSMNDAMRSVSDQSALILTLFPNLPPKNSAREGDGLYQSFVDGLRSMASGLPPIGFVAKKGQAVVAMAI